MIKWNNQEVKNAIDGRFHKYIDREVYEVDEVSAKSLLSSARVDIYLKYYFAKCWIEEKNNTVKLDYLKSLYATSIDLFTNGTFVEPGDSDKKNLQDFLETFESLIDSIANTGSANVIIPVDESNVPLDGAHRIAVCAALELDVKIVKISGISACFDLAFFEKKGASRDFIGNTLSLMMEQDERVRAAIIWPNATAPIQDIIELYNSDVIYTHSLDLNQHGVENLCTLLYRNEPWIGGPENKWSGAKRKAKNCYKSGRKCQVLYFVSHGLEHSLKIKENVRELNDGTKHSIHSTDTLNEAKEILSCSIFSGCEREINNLNRSVLAKVYGSDPSVIFTSSVVLELYNIRLSRDFDYLRNPNCKPVDISWADEHNKLAEFYGDISSFFITPSKIRSYMGIKFISLDSLVDFKSKRNEDKDIQDINLVSKFRKLSVADSLNRMSIVFGNRKIIIKRFKVKIKKKIRSFFNL